MTDELLEHVADIVSAHVSNNSVAMADVPNLIRSVHAAFARLGQAPAPVETERTPVVSVRSSVKPDMITCLDCGAKVKMLKRHIRSEHALSPEEYRARWNLPPSYPMVAPQYSERRKELANAIGLGRKPSSQPGTRGEAAAVTQEPVSAGAGDPAATGAESQG